MYARCEARLGAMMTKSRHCCAYTPAQHRFPPERQLALVADLKKDPFISSALSNENGGADMCCLRRNTRNLLKVLRVKKLGVRVTKVARESMTLCVYGQTGCGETQFVLDELLHPERGSYRNAFVFVFIVCPTWKRNRTYRPWLWCGLHDSRFYFIEPGERLHDWLRLLFSMYERPRTAPIPIETVSSRDINHKRARLAALAAGGQAKLTFKGHLVNTERVDALTDTEVEVYARCEARLGAMMTRAAANTRVLEYSSTTRVVNYSSNFLLLKYSLISISGCKFPFAVAVFAVN